MSGEASSDKDVRKEREKLVDVESVEISSNVNFDPIPSDDSPPTIKNKDQSSKTATNVNETESDTVQTPKGRRKARGSRTKKDEEIPHSSIIQRKIDEMTKYKSRGYRGNFPTALQLPNSTTAVFPQSPLMFSAPPGQFMILQHNGHCYLMPSSQCLPTNQQMTAIRPVIRPNIVSSDAPLGQLLKSINSKQNVVGSTMHPVQSPEMIPMSCADSSNPPPTTSSSTSVPVPAYSAAPNFQQGFHVRSTSPLVLQLPPNSFTLRPHHQSMQPTQNAQVLQSLPTVVTNQTTNNQSFFKNSGQGNNCNFQPLPDSNKSQFIGPGIASTGPMVSNSNIMPIAAQMPVMLTMPHVTPFANPTMPVIASSSVSVASQQHPYSAGPMQAHPVFPVLQQLQQNVQIPVPYHIEYANANEKTNPPTGTRKRAAEETGSLDSGVENDPPPLLIPGEQGDACGVHQLFLSEADRFCSGKSDTVIHIIDGFIIEESDKPFVSDEEFKSINIKLNEIELLEESIVETHELNNFVPDKQDITEPKIEKTKQSPGGKKTKPRRIRITQRKKAGLKKVDENADKKRKKKANELERLLDMDFGSQGCLRDIIQQGDNELPVGNEEMPNMEVETTVEEEIPLPAIEVQPEAENPLEKSVQIEQSLNTAPEGESLVCSSTEQSSINTSKSSAVGGSAANSNFRPIFSDEELDSERCNYCAGLLRLKRYENHPQYCSKKCRKLWKRKPLILEEQNARISSSFASTISPQPKEVNKVSPMKPSVFEVSTPTKPVTEQQRPPTLTLKKVSPQQAEIVKTSVNTNDMRMIRNVDEPSISNQTDPVEHAYLSQPPQTWTCDEVAKWVCYITGSSDCAAKFRSQDIDGQSLLLLAENPHHFLGTVMRLKVGPLVKVQNALDKLLNTKTSCPE